MSTASKSNRTTPNSYYCVCGGQWHGRYVGLGASVIADHGLRGHERITHEEFKLNYRCGCSECTGNMPSKFVAKRDLVALLRRALRAIDAQCAVSETYYDDTAEVRRAIVDAVGEPAALAKAEGRS